MLKKILLDAAMALVSTAAIDTTPPILKKAELGFAVSTNAALKDLKSTEFTSAWRMGFSASDDSPRVIYTSTNAACSLNTGAGDDGSQVKLADDNCAVAAMSSAQTSPLIWGVAPDGTDHSTALQAAVNYVCAKGGGELEFPVGTYQVHDINIPCAVRIAGVVRAATVINYAAATGYAFQWQAPGFPAFRSNGHILGGGIENITLNYVGRPGTATAINIEGVQDWYSQHVTINTPYNGVFGIGDEKVDFSDVTMNGTSHSNYNFVGDLSGQTASGAPCTAGNADCSTRSDFIVMHDIENIDNLQTNVGINIQGTVGAVIGEHFAFEGANIGLSISCPAGLDPNMSQCPHFIYLDDLQIEFFKTYGIQATDALDLKFVKPYLYGDGTASNVNDAYFSTVNYAGSTVPPGKIKLEQGMFFSTQHECIALAGTLTDFKLLGSDVSGCNIANVSAYALLLGGSTGSLSQAAVEGNTFCTVSGYAGASPPAGVGIAAGTKQVQITGNSFYGCSSRIGNFSSNPYTVIDRDNLGPGGPPTIAAGTCGTRPSITGTDESFAVTIGTGRPNSCAVNLGTAQMIAPNCAWSPASKSTGPVSMTSSNTQVNFSGTSMSGRFHAVCKSN